LTKSALKTILVLEDEPLVMSVLQHVLERTGFVVLRAHSAEEAVEQFRRYREKIDLLIADLAVPGGSGSDVALGCARASARLRVLLTSGSPPTAWSEGDRECFDLLPIERVGFLQKPFSPRVLVERVVDLIEAEAGMRARA
jgi:DNA-binding response OmpR family regulator